MCFILLQKGCAYNFAWSRYPDEILSTKIIGERQFKTAVELFESASEELTGKIEYRQVYLNFTDIEVELDSNKVVKTCPAALGPGFAAGTTDGPGLFGFQQGDTKVCAFIILPRNSIITYFLRNDEFVRRAFETNTKTKNSSSFCCSYCFGPYSDNVRLCFYPNINGHGILM